MSRAYRISLARSLSRHVKVDDGVQSALELLPILPVERMSELLAAELEGQGFERDADHPQLMRLRDEDGVEVEVDLDKRTVTARLAAEADVDLEARGSTRSEREDDPQARERLARRLDSDLERMADEEQDKLRQQLTRTLEGKLRDLQQQLDGVVNRVSAAALKEKAAQLGEIEEISEDEQTGSLTIRVRV